MHCNVRVGLCFAKDLRVFRCGGWSCCGRPGFLRRGGLFCDRLGLQHRHGAVGTGDVLGNEFFVALGAGADFPQDIEYRFHDALEVHALLLPLHAVVPGANQRRFQAQIFRQFRKHTRRNLFFTFLQCRKFGIGRICLAEISARPELA